AVYTIGRLGELVGLSRSTLLYYDSIGLLRPSGRSGAGYRLYTEDDRRRLERIVALRRTGLALERIASCLEGGEDGPAGMLLRRVFDINGEIEGLRAQQKALLDLIEADGRLKDSRRILHGLEALGREAGVDRDSYLGIHQAFERSSPEAHRRLLGFLGFAEPDIEDFLSTLNDSL
ncbi:MAG TPA: MerR family transcriptional regulator, partial [Rectinemataceae bacterium]|nr:MerR family transcriptional regulator [Rectinemataceae bacterium]